MAEVPTKKQAKEQEVVEQKHTTIKRLPWYKRLWEWFIALFVNDLLKETFLIFLSSSRFSSYFISEFGNSFSSFCINFFGPELNSIILF